MTEIETTHTMRTLRIGTRRSALARWQTEHVASLLEEAWPGAVLEIVGITTRGDRVLDTPLPQIGGKGLFTEELEGWLRAGTIDFAVHSLKDLPTELPTGLTIGAIPLRADPSDALISREGYTLATLPDGATIGTSSHRRAAQLLYRRPDLKIRDIRGNVDTRIAKAKDPKGPYDAILLARAGIERLGWLGEASDIIPPDLMLPAPGQGALAVQCRDEAGSLEHLAPLNHLPTGITVTAERGFLAGLGGGCALPIGAYATIADGTLELRGRVVSPDGARQIDVQISVEIGADHVEALAQAWKAGSELARQALAQGADAILGALE